MLLGLSTIATASHAGTPASPPPAASAVDSTAGGRSAVPRRAHVGVELGVQLPRAALDAGLLVGVVGTYALDQERRWAAHLRADWVRTGRRAQALLTPSPFPRSQAEVDDHTDLLTFVAGVSCRLATFDRMEVRAGAFVGAQASRGRFEAFSMDDTESGVGPAAMAEVSIGMPAGPAVLRAVVGWREARRTLDHSSSYAEETTSGATFSVRADW